MNDLTLESIVSASILPIKPQNTIQDALHMMADHRISSVIVTDLKDKPIGIFTEHDALKIIANSVELSTQLREVMTTNLFTLEGSMTLHDAYILLEKKGFRHLIVTNKNKEYLGIVSEGDFMRNMGFEHVTELKTVEDVMSDAPLTVGPDVLITQAAKMMSERHCDYAIVVEDSHPRGILRERDIARYFAKKDLVGRETVEILEFNDMPLVSKSIQLQEAASIMENHGVHQLIVINEHKEVIGLLDRHDVLKAVNGAYFDFLMKVIDKKSSDIKLLNQNKKLLATKTALLDNVINTIPDLIWLKDLDGIYLSCNHMFERLYGAKESEILGKTDFDFVDAALASFFRENDKKAIEAGGSRNNEEYLIFADGSYEGLFDTIKTPMKDDDGNIIGVLGIARDVSDKKARLDALNEAQSLAHIGSWKLNIQENVLEWSDECYRLFGIEVGTPLSYDSFLHMIHPDDREHVNQAWTAALHGSSYDIDHRIIVEGIVKWVRERARLETDANGRLITGFGTVQDITQRKLYEDELEHLASYDQLTGLANRSLFSSSLEKSIYSAMRNKRSIALLLFDLDHFKDINDSFGHSAGDELLKMVASRFRDRIRQGDLITRLGGDEFTVILESIDRVEDAAVVAQEMIDALSQPYELSSKAQVYIGSSVGIAIAPQHSTNAEELLQYADTALYKAKSEGRSTFSYYSDELTLTARERIAGENRLRRAIKNSEFELYYQPQVHIKTGRIIGAESLIRWNDPDLGLISPNDFIPLAEETGLIAPIGEWVMLESCRQAKQWLDDGHNLHVSVNVSPNQIHHQDIAELVDTALNNSGFIADKLTLELTESAMMKREEEVVAKLHALRAKGVRIAIDDFGTGYSSYSYLKRFPIDILKIDKSFIDDIPYERDDMAIVSAIIAMGTAMGYQILAEGTEHIEQIEFLQENGCTYYQGYYKSKPLPAKEFEKLLKDNS